MIVLNVINMSGKSIELLSHIQSNSDIKPISAYRSIPDIHTSNHY